MSLQEQFPILAIRSEISMIGVVGKGKGERGKRWGEMVATGQKGEDGKRN